MSKKSIYRGECAREKVIEVWREKKCAHITHLCSCVGINIVATRRDLFAYYVHYLLYGIYALCSLSFCSSSARARSATILLFIIFIGSKISIERIIIFVRLYHNLHVTHHSSSTVNHDRAHGLIQSEKDNPKQRSRQFMKQTRKPQI